MRGISILTSHHFFRILYSYLDIHAAKGRLSMERLGEYITYLVQVLRDIKKYTMMRMMEELSERLHISPSTLHKWRENTLRPSFSAQEALVAIGITEAHLPIEWARSLLLAGKHPQYEAILNRYFAPPRAVRHNLPPRYDGFVARPEAIQEVERRLVNRTGDSIVAILGLKGMGKTTLAREVAWHFVEAFDTLPEQARFDTIVWVSAHQYRFTVTGLQKSFRYAASMVDIFAALAGVVEHAFSRTLTTWETQQPYLDELLRMAGRLLLILDDEEEMHDEIVKAFLADLPPSVKAMIVTQVPGSWPNPVRVDAFDDAQLASLLRQECASHNIDFDALFPTQADVHAFGEMTGHIPLVAWWAIAIIAVYGMTLTDVHRELQVEQQERTAQGDLLRFLFRDFVQLCYTRNMLAYDALLVLSFYEDGAPLEEIAQILERPASTCRIALRMLCDFHLVRHIGESDRYLLPSIVREYMPREPMGSEESELEAKAQRWLDYYVRFIARNSAACDAHWTPIYDRLQAASHVLWGPTSILTWCASHLGTCYDKLAVLWFEHGLDQMTYIYCYWPEQLHYLDVLIPAARERHDALHLLWGLLSKANTLTLMYLDLGEIGTLLDEATQLCTDVMVGIPLAWRCRTTIMRAFDYTHQERYEEALALLHSIRKYFCTPAGDPLAPEDFTDRAMQRAVVEYWYRLGMATYYQELAQKSLKFTAAHDALTRAWRFSILWGFEQLEFAAMNYLIDITIFTDPKGAQEDFDLAWPRVQQSKDRRRIAGFIFLNARLMWERNHNDVAACHLAEQALEVFRSLHMAYEIGRVGAFITDLAEHAWEKHQDRIKTVELSNRAIQIYVDCERTYPQSVHLPRQHAEALARNRMLQQQCNAA
jgi:transcriptional regulator with XRE-family HTH domain